MADAHERPMYRPGQSAMRMTEMLWPPLAALRAIERWSSATGGTHELPGEIARLSERVASVEQHENALQSAVEPIERDLDGLNKAKEGLARQLSETDSALRSVRKELDGLRKAHAELERRSDVGALEKELDGLRKSNAALERSVAELQSAPGGAPAPRPARPKTSAASRAKGKATAKRTASSAAKKGS